MPPKRGFRNTGAGFWDEKPSGAARAAPAPAPRQQRSDVQSEGLSEYEQKRLEQIKFNDERMRALGLQALSSALLAEARPPRPTAKPKGLSTKRKRSEVAPPRRESLRMQGKSPDGTQVYSERQGQVVLINGEAVRFRPDAVLLDAAAVDGSRSRHDPAPQLRLVCDRASPATDEAFLALLCHLGGAALGADDKPRGGDGGGGSEAERGDQTDAAEQEGGQATGLATRRRRRAAAPAAKPTVERRRLPTAQQLAGLALRGEDVAKVTRSGIAHLAFHPTTHTLLLATGDKGGSLGLWHVDHDSWQGPWGISERAIEDGGWCDVQAPAGSPAAAGGAALEAEPDAAEAEPALAFEGVLAAAPHRQYVSGLRWVGGAGGAVRLLTSSYDGSVRSLDPGNGSFQLLHSDDEAGFSAMDATADGGLIVLADSDGRLHFLDPRARAAAAPAAPDVHARKINTVHFDPGAEQCFATSSTDKAVCVWDVRALGAAMQPLLRGEHAASCQGAYFAPDGSRRLATTSFDDTVRVWDAARGGPALPQLLNVAHNNKTGQYILPFRAVWTPAADALVIGSMSDRAVDVLDAATGRRLAALRCEAMTAIPARSCVHPVLPALAAGTASGRAHVFR